MHLIFVAPAAAAALLSLGGPTFAAGLELQSPVAIPHVEESRYADSQSAPYAMNYSDEAAQRLGLHDGQWEAFKSSDSLMPTVRGGLRGGNPMLTLQWQPDS